MMVDSIVLLWCLILWPVLFVPICFALYYAYKNESSNDVPTLSETGTFRPENALFTYGLHLESVFLLLVCISIYKKYVREINSIKIIPRIQKSSSQSFNDSSSFCSTTNENDAINMNANANVPTISTIKQLQFWNKFALYVGYILSFLISLVGSIALTVDVTSHTVIAFFMFAAAILHMLIFYFAIDTQLFNALSTSSTLNEEPISIEIEGESSSYHRELQHLLLLRQVNYKSKLWKIRFSILMCIPFNILVICLTIGVYSSSCSSSACVGFTANILQLLEFSTVISLMFYFDRYRWDLSFIQFNCSYKDEVDNNNNHSSPVYGEEKSQELLHHN
mmetsp:Transcript_390/g.617  ORF Transcript_390/g.617 Transcript_390/m.617 type:complete len:335 (-) Transcript_390:1064-2068(-)